MIVTSLPLGQSVIAGAAVGESASIRAFPSAEGFGAYSQGGRGGKVYHVTNLEDQGPGSLRKAVETKGSRTIVFDVSGTIELESDLEIENPFITIAGQTAPGDGISLRDHALEIETSHVVVRYLRSRLGNVSGDEDDAISITEGRHIILDHCSASWSLDEVLSSSTSEPGLSELTVQWCFITEGLNPDDHSFGSLIRGCCGARYSYHHNLYAHNRNRNPRPGNYGDSNPHTDDPKGLLLDFRNNVIYNWRGDYAGYNADENSVTRLNYLNNFLIPGPESDPKSKAYYAGSHHNRAYFRGNWMDYRLPEDPWSVVRFDSSWGTAAIRSYKRSKPFKPAPIHSEPAYESYRKVLAYGGASFPTRDAVDSRIINTIQARSGRIINSQSEVSGWPELRSTPAPKDGDGDGMPDYWERHHGFAPNDPRDGARDRDGNGYTNLEEYLNGLVSVPNDVD